MQCNIFLLTVIVAVLGGLTNRLYMHIHDDCCSIYIYTYVYIIHNGMHFTFGIILHIYSLFLLFFLHNIHVDVYILFQEGVSHSQLYLVVALSEIYWCTFVKSLNVCKKKIRVISFEMNESYIVALWDKSDKSRPCKLLLIPQSFQGNVFRQWDTYIRSNKFI